MKSSYGTKSAMFSGLCSIPCGAADAIRQQENGKNGANDPTVACSTGSEVLDESHLMGIRFTHQTTIGCGLAMLAWQSVIKKGLTVTGQEIRFEDLPASVRDFLVRETSRKGKDNRRWRISNLFARTVRRIRAFLARAV